MNEFKFCFPEKEDYSDVKDILLDKETDTKSK